MNFPKIDTSYYHQKNVVNLAEKMLGKMLFTNFNNKVTGGIITEAEAYNGIYDRACHAFGGRRTPRTETMYALGGVSYVYLCYGIHHLFNIVTNKKDIPDAILIRAIEPTHGVSTMLKRRNKNKIDKTLSGGPGTVSQALGISVKNNALDLSGSKIWIAESGLKIKKNQIASSARIGCESAGEDGKLPYRFNLINAKKELDSFKNSN
ncbi:MAG: DNA-3-methyladenine glycosylase [Bacteroidia bacterium]|nr:DNA-3-methyladenine glycosylase [Bacteroidia bacterium]NNC85197.1 DNA-3-methyladenine glycosylase [Bacteroidia bacterium]